MYINRIDFYSFKIFSFERYINMAKVGNGVSDGPSTDQLTDEETVGELETLEAVRKCLV